MALEESPKSRTTAEYVKRKYLSVSTLLEYARCPRRYFHRKCGLVHNNEALAPQYGTCMHSAVPVALTSSDLGSTMNAFLAQWEPIELELALNGFEEDPKRNRVTAQRSLQHFIFTHEGQKSLYKLLPPPVGGLETDERTSPFEVPWAIDIGLEVPLVGRLDGLCQHRDTGEHYVWEFKTTSYLDARFFDAHEMYPQNLTYSVVANTQLSMNVKGVMVEAMLVNERKVDNVVQPIPVQLHHMEDILVWLKKTGRMILDAEAEFLNRSDPNDFTAFEKNFCGCTPYPHFYWPGYRCEYADMCRVPDWRPMASLYKVVPDHDFLAEKGISLTQATVSASTPMQGGPINGSKSEPKSN